MEVMKEARDVSLVKNANHKDARGVKRPVYRAVGKVVRRDLDRGAVNMIIHIKVDNLTESQELVENRTSCLIKNLSFTVCFTHLVKHPAQAALPDGAEFYDQSGIRAVHDKEAASDLPLTRMSPVFCIRHLMRTKTDEEEVFFSSIS